MVIGISLAINRREYVAKYKYPIGVLQGDGISDLIPKIIKVAKKGNTKVIYDTDPKKLVLRFIKILK